MNNTTTKSMYKYIWIIVILLFAIPVYQFINVRNNFVPKIVIQKENENKKAKELLDDIKKRIEGKSLSELALIPKLKISEKPESFVLIYIPSQICFTCVERLIKSIVQKNKGKLLLIIEKGDNPALLGLIKYYRLQDICEYDNDSIFTKQTLNGSQVKKPLAFLIKNKVISGSFFIGDKVEKDLEVIFTKFN